MPYSIYSSASFEASIGSESSYNSGAGTSYGALGVGMAVDEFQLQNQFTPLYQLGQRTPIEYYSQGHKTAVSLSFVLANDNYNWLNFVLQNMNSTVTPTFETTAAASNINTMFIKMSGATNTRTISGVAINDTTLDFSEGKTVDVKMSGVGASGTITTGAVSTTYPSQPVTWVTVGAGTVTAQPVQSANLTISNTLGQYYGLGSVTYQLFVPLEFSVTGKLTVYHNSGLVEQLFSQPVAGQSSNSLVLTAGNYTFTIGGLYLDQGNIKVAPVTTVLDEIDFKGETLTVTA